MKDTRSVREKAMRDVETLEAERTRLMEERQTLEVELVRERMNSKTREAEYLLSLSQAKEEAEHQRRRAEMLHEEYQKRIQEALQSDVTPNDPKRVPKPTTLKPMQFR